MRGRKHSAARPEERSTTVSMKIAIKDRKGCNISAVRKRLKTVNQRRGVDKTKNF
ncbi:hypothetical protein E2C01_070315 [Portunus trituberculatus]|uniref:Uncharacterized protein n=1 Tax=Portunus trituberculatus TaxID=210409 RepID=A0A5B7I194_PORTR|nr:hypothetical protein [Portunus trituberculatus]